MKATVWAAETGGRGGGAIGSPGGVRVQLTQTYGELSEAAAEIILAELKQNPRLLFCASAGGTPTGLYQCLATRFARQPRLFSQKRVVQIDEWAGVPSGHAATCETDLRTKLLLPLRITANRFRAFKSDAADPSAECAGMGEWLRVNGPIDICILGLGTNGHIAMNEPGESLMPAVHFASLTRQSQQHGMLTDLQTKPKHGFTLGMADLLASKKILLLVSGAHKQDALQQVLAGKVSTRFPASFLWLHPDATILCDREAMGKRHGAKMGILDK